MTLQTVVPSYWPWPNLLKTQLVPPRENNVHPIGGSANGKLQPGHSVGLLWHLYVQDILAKACDAHQLARNGSGAAPAPLA